MNNEPFVEGESMFLSKAWLVGVIASILIVAGCSKDSGGNDKPTYKLDDQEYLVVDSGNLTHGTTELSGSGKIIMKTPLASIDSGRHFALKGTLDDGGYLTITTYASAELKDGLSLKLARTGNTLKAQLSQGDETKDLAAALTSILSEDSITVALDVHNDESPAHVMVWKGDTTDFTEESALVNTEEEPAPGNGKGIYWGLELSKAKVTDAVSEDPKLEEE
jgi:hypothetical protein